MSDTPTSSDTGAARLAKQHDMVRWNTRRPGMEHWPRSFACISDTKPMGYVDDGYIHRNLWLSPESAMRQLETFGLKVIHTSPVSMQDDTLYAYDEKALKDLLDRNRHIVAPDITPEDFVRWVNNNIAREKTPLFDLVADAFGDDWNPGRTDNPETKDDQDVIPAKGVVLKKEHIGLTHLTLGGEHRLLTAEQAASHLDYTGFDMLKAIMADPDIPADKRANEAFTDIEAFIRSIDYMRADPTLPTAEKDSTISAMFARLSYITLGLPDEFYESKQGDLLDAMDALEESHRAYEQRRHLGKSQPAVPQPKSNPTLNIARPQKRQTLT